MLFSLGQEHSFQMSDYESLIEKVNYPANEIEAKKCTLKIDGYASKPGFGGAHFELQAIANDCETASLDLREAIIEMGLKINPAQP